MESVSSSFDRHIVEALAEQENPLRPWALIPVKQISKKTLKSISEIAEVRIVSEAGEEYFAFNYSVVFGEVFTPEQEQALIAGKKV